MNPLRNARFCPCKIQIDPIATIARAMMLLRILITTLNAFSMRAAPSQMYIMQSRLRDATATTTEEIYGANKKIAGLFADCDFDLAAGLRPGCRRTRAGTPFRGRA